jgi:colicin import membrane protein
MPALAERPEFLPPPEGGLVRAMGIALLAHALLVLAFSLGLQWKREDDSLSVEAEIWSPTVQQAAPRAVEVPPAPPPVQPPVVQPPPAPPQKSDADIVQEREKQRLAQEQAQRAEEQERQRKLAADRKRQDDLKKQEQAKKDADKRKLDDQAKLRKQKQDEDRVAKQREENLKRMQGLAGATGGQASTGTAMQSSGPSSSYAGRVRGRVKPNIVFTDNVAGNPSAEVEVRLAPDGTIVGRRLAKPSGITSWDDAVLRAIDRTEVFPRDVDGRVPAAMILVFRPKDL